MATTASSFALLWSRTWELLGAHAPRAVVWLLILVALGVSADLSLEDVNRYNLLNLIAGCTVTVAHYALSLAAVRSTVPPGAKPASFARYFLLSLLIGLAFIAGFAAFLLPGIFLAVRWSPIVPAMISADLTIGEAFRWSWQATRGLFWPILLLLVTIWLPAIALVTLALSLEDPAPTVLSALMLNLAVSGATIASVYAAVAVFGFTGARPGIEEVFA